MRGPDAWDIVKLKFKAWLGTSGMFERQTCSRIKLEFKTCSSVKLEFKACSRVKPEFKACTRGKLELETTDPEEFTTDCCLSVNLYRIYRAGLVARGIWMKGLLSHKDNTINMVTPKYRLLVIHGGEDHLGNTRIILV